MVAFISPYMFFFAIPAVLILWYLIRTDFVRLPEDKEFTERKERWRRWITVSRILIVAALVIALAQPYVEVTRETSGDPRLTVLVDNSSSMEVMDTSFLPRFLDQLKEEIPVKVRDVGEERQTTLGDGTLAHLQQGENVLLVSDGWNNAGTNLGDVSLFASQSNATISALDLTSKERDASVTVLGPKKAVKDVNSSYLVRVSKPGIDTYSLTVTIDGETIIDTTTSQETVSFEHRFTEAGDHEIRASVSTSGTDYFPQNNEFYKAVSVVEKPRILYMSNKNSPLETILNELYEVDKRSSLPNDLSPYYAIIVNDMQAANFRDQDTLSEFLIDGNGMVVFGGFNSYDRGGYKNSVFEQLLPVKVGNAERSYGDNTVALAIDRSKGGGKCRIVVDTVTKTKREVCSDVAPIDIIKAQSLEIVNQFDETNKVGTVAFDTGTYLIEPVDSLYNNKDGMTEKIRKIQPGSDTLVSKGLEGAYNLLSGKEGNRYAILLTDGLTYEGDRQQTVQMAGRLYQEGIKVITVGIGRGILEDFLKDTAANGGGFYVSADNKGRLKVLFGDPDENETDDGTYGLVTVNSGHFITRNAEPTAVLQGYNQVIPKSSAQMLVATDSGEPALTTWRYGLGKVASWNVFTGNSLGELLNEQNSILLSKTVNWAIGDPERKKAYVVDVPDGRVGNQLKVSVKAEQIPTAEGLEFVKQDENEYEATITPNVTGFDSVLQTKYAVNYPVEYQDLGMNPQLQDVTSSTGGNVFKPGQVQQIVEFVRSVSTRTVTERRVLVWPFILAAISLFLVEVLLRRISQSRTG